MHDGLYKKPYITDLVYDEAVPNLLNLLKLYKDNPEIQNNVYQTLALFAKNKVYGSSMVNSGLLNSIKDTLENPTINENLRDKQQIRNNIFNLLDTLVKEEVNGQKISDELMGTLLKDLDEQGYEGPDGRKIVDIGDTLLNNNECVQPFVQFKGLDLLAKLLNDNDTNVDLILQLFQMFKKVANTSDEYKNMMQERRLPDLINKIIKKAGPYDKKVEFEGRKLIFLINMCKVKLEDPDAIDLTHIKIEEPIPPEVRNYLTSGKQVKIISDHGDVKQMQLTFNQDLLKVSCKKIKSNLPPKPKYIIDTPTIKKLLKGHGTDAFKKSKGLFRKVPKPELCFSIIGPTTVDGTKSFNVECESEAEVDRWIKYIEIVINYFRKTHTIKGTVVIKK